MPSQAKHYRVEGTNNEVANKLPNINGVKSFRAYQELRSSRVNGIRKTIFNLQSKESGYRFDYFCNNVYRFLIKAL